MFVRTMGHDPKTHFRIGLDDITVARLLELADMCQCDPTLVISAIIRDVLEDDALAHDGEFAPSTVQ